MKIVCSININGKMFDKLVEIGFIRIPNIQDFHYPSSRLEDFEQGLINVELVAHRKNEIAESLTKDVAQTMLNEVEGKIVECLNTGVKDVSGLLELKKTYEAILKNEQG